MSATARDLIRGSLRLIGAVGVGETPEAADLNDALFALNEMLDSWSNENLMIPTRSIETFPLVGGQQVYTMGPAGNFATVRPLQIEHAAIVDQNASTPFEAPLKLINTQEWAAQSAKTLSSALPTRLYSDDQYPLTNLTLWPAPTVTKQIRITSVKPLAQIANVSATLDLAPGYLEALRYNLALRLAPEYGEAATSKAAAIVEFANNAKANIKRQNTKPIYIACDDGATGRRRGFNYILGE